MKAAAFPQILTLGTVVLWGESVMGETLLLAVCRALLCSQPVLGGGGGYRAQLLHQCMEIPCTEESVEWSTPQ